jgi:cytochrome c551/c552
MNNSSSGNETRRRRPLRLALLGCAVLISLMVCALAINAAYWTIRMRPVGAALEPALDATPVATLVALELLPAGDAANGEALFRSEGCFACHSLEPAESGIGPSLAGVAERAAGQSNDSAEVYLVESIIDPDAYVVDGFQDGIMPQGFGQRLTEQQLADLVAFLMSR